MLLQTFAISKRFGGIVALDGVHFAAERGEVHAILGENGAGKSTFIQILGGSLAPDAGEIRLDGAVLRPRSPRDAQRAGISCVYQELSLIPDLSVAENIWFGAQRRTVAGTIPRRRLYERTEALFAELGLPPLRPASPVRSLSIGEQQLVEIAKSLARDPRVIVLDEATSALSPVEVDWLLATARRLADAGKVVLYISHRLAEVRRVADRVTVLRNGERVGTHTTTELSDTDIVTMMLGREGSMRTYPEIGVADPHHPLTHHRNNPEWIEKVTQVNTMHMELFASFVKKLKATPDGDGTLLDHSAIVYGSGLSDGNRHTHDDLPVLIVGRGGDLRLNRHIVYPKDTPMTNLYLTLLDRMGVRTESLGDSTGAIEHLTDV